MRMTSTDQRGVFLARWFRSRRLHLVCAGSLMVWGGCAAGGGHQQRPLVPPGTPVAALSDDPCSLVTPDEAATILGAPVIETHAFESNTSCEYIADAVADQKTLTLVVRRGEAVGDTAQGFEMYRGDTPILEGVAERAFYRGNEINVLKGETWVQIFTSDETAPEEAMVDEARTVASRL
jgi:hypothetical protein